MVPGNIHRLDTDSGKRKEIPIATGALDYFPDAIAAVAELSYGGNKKHNPGEPLHWNRDKSADEPDALMRHFLERGTVDTDGVRHSTKVAWRALAMLQKELEAEMGLPISRGSRQQPVKRTPQVQEWRTYGDETNPYPLPRGALKGDS